MRGSVRSIRTPIDNGRCSTATASSPIEFPGSLSIAQHFRNSVRIGRDLFGEWTMICQFGRAGTRGREVHHAALNTLDLRHLLQTALKRRISAPKRIGCAYKLSDFSAANDDTSDWFPRDGLATHQ
jgi:hypothetical protein